MNSTLEDKWTNRWERLHIFEANVEPSRRKVFVTFPIPYMNGPLHIGHAYTASRVDSYAKFKKLQGFNVLFPQGWHWTGQPIVSAAERLAKGDEKMIREFKEVDKVPDEVLEKFKDPVFMARYYTDRNRTSMKRLGLGIDWRREFTTTKYDPRFSKFIEWQFLTLREKGFISRGSHPVVWCPKDKSPVGDHDRLQGEGVYPVEFRLIFFKLVDEDAYLVASTLRPETIFGTTNVWVHPDLEYVVAEINRKKWIIGESSAERLRDQLFEVKVLQKVKGAQLIGRKVVVPLIQREVPVLPARFIDPNIGTAVVYSVPAHAPYDYLALRDLQKAGDPSALKIAPISIIEVEGYGDFPAVEEVERLKIKDQNDPSADLATKNVYAAEFRKGRMKENCGEFAGMPVNAARKAVYDKLEELGLSASMWELPEPVICRCTTRCHVKILQDQWFLRYSDEGWKNLARECINSMKIYPNEARQWFLDVVDWLNDYPCARQSGLGTPLPWDTSWLVETLSDSTVYMAYYTIAHKVKKYSPEQLTKEVFDYVFLGRGDPYEISKRTGIAQDDLISMREEFLYWYPVDLRVSAKELVPNHLTFFIFHHVAIFDRELWPRAIAVNGMLRIEGEKMSKSKGNVITIDEAISQFGADALRISLLSSSEYMDDANFKRDYALSTKLRLEKILGDLKQDLANAARRGRNFYDDWLLNSMAKVSREISQYMDSMNIKAAVTEAFFVVDNLYRKYKKYTDEQANADVVREFAKLWSIIIAPFAPFFAEELYSAVGTKESVFYERWPEIGYDESVDVEMEVVERLIEDIKSVLKVFKGRPNEIKIAALAADEAGKFERKEVDPQLYGKYMKHRFTLPESLVKMIGKVDELEVYRKHQALIEKETGVKISVMAVNDLKSEERAKGKVPLPFKPVIIIT
ncbi:MAG: leucine--tRNA ligase [Nitrososphaeria archaeon]